MKIFKSRMAYVSSTQRYLSLVYANREVVHRWYRFFNHNSSSLVFAELRKIAPTPRQQQKTRLPQQRSKNSLSQSNKTFEAFHHLFGHGSGNNVWDKNWGFEKRFSILSISEALFACRYWYCECGLVLVRMVNLLRSRHSLGTIFAYRRWIG